MANSYTLLVNYLRTLNFRIREKKCVISSLVGKKLTNDTRVEFPTNSYVAKPIEEFEKIP